MKTVKKLVALMLAVLMICALVGCGGKATAKIIDIPLSSEEYAFAVNPNDAELLTSVNTFLKEIKANGKFDEVVSHYFDKGTPIEVESAKEDSSKDQLVVVTEPGFAPFEYTSGNKYLGIDMELAKMLADYLGKELVIKSIDFQAIFDTLNTNGADIGMAGITINETRKLSVNFSDPYYNASQKLIVKSTDKKFDKCKTKEDVDKILQGFNSKTKIGVQTGTTGQLYVDGSKDFDFKKLDAKSVGYKNGSLAVTDMLNGSVDYVILDEEPAKRITESINKLR